MAPPEGFWCMGISVDIRDVDDLLSSLAIVSAMLKRWHLDTSDWALLDGPAIKVVEHDFDSSAWRDHLNIYVVEERLPWRTKETELTIPPKGSAELGDKSRGARL